MQKKWVFKAVSYIKKKLQNPNLVIGINISFNNTDILQIISQILINYMFNVMKVCKD